jgi:enoyl-CoA hydratase/carnithine racemase
MAELFLAGALLSDERGHALGIVCRVVAADELEAESVALAPLSARSRAARAVAGR